MIGLRAGLLTLRDSYERMDRYRAVTLAACPVVPTPACPAALRLFRAAATAESGIQRLVQARWSGQQVRWRLGSGSRSGFPGFDFPIATGTERDLARSWLAEYDRKTARPYTLRIRDVRMVSGAECRRSGNEWKIAWTE